MSSQIQEEDLDRDADPSRATRTDAATSYNNRRATFPLRLFQILSQ